EDRKKKKVKSMKKKKKEKKKRRKSLTSSSDDSVSSVTSSSSEERRRLKKKKKKDKKMKKKKNKIEKPTQQVDEGADMVGPQVPSDLPKAEEERPKMAPMTKEEWDKRQSVVRRVYDETTGRHRLIKGDGEVLEEIVSRDRHKEINRLATAGDGAYFQSKLPQPHR
ncbi:hypothetical protein GE061_004677, partial [Apolygus lucorum]